MFALLIYGWRTENGWDCTRCAVQNCELFWCQITTLYISQCSKEILWWCYHMLLFAINDTRAMHILYHICSRNYQIIFSDILYICALFLGATWYTYSLLFLFLRCGRSPYSTSYTTLESIILRLWVVLTNLLFFYLSLRARIAKWAFKSHAQSKCCTDNNRSIKHLFS